MKNNWTFRLAGLAIVLALVTTSLVAGTFAKYATKVEATDTVVVAKWKADFTTNKDSNTTFDLFGTAFSDTGVDGKKLAPGTVGSFALKYDTSGTQVARNVNITLDASLPLADLTYLKFYSDATRTNEIIPSSGILTLVDKDFAPTAPGTEETVTVYWAWPFSADATQDAADTADGTAAKSYNVTATFTATQLDTYSAP